MMTLLTPVISDELPGCIFVCILYSTRLNSHDEELGANVEKPLFLCFLQHSVHIFKALRAASGDMTTCPATVALEWPRSPWWAISTSPAATMTTSSLSCEGMNQFLFLHCSHGLDWAFAVFCGDFFLFAYVVKDTPSLPSHVHHILGVLLPLDKLIVSSCPCLGVIVMSLSTFIFQVLQKSSETNIV